ncbi:MAG: sigma-70 family RNA polymerase sigma factor [Terriglobia bacterium]
MDTLRWLELTVDRVTPATEEATLVHELQAGSEDAFGYLLGVYQNPVFNLVCHMVENPADAADVLQEVFLKVCRGIRHFHGESSLKTWIYKIAVHEASNHRRGWLRRLRREPFSLEDSKGEPVMYSARSLEETPYEALEQAERRELVSRALASLAPPYRAAVILREMEGMSYEEIARVLQVAEGTVKSRLMRGREMLRSKLAGLLGDRSNTKVETRNSKVAKIDVSGIAD